MPCRKRDDQIAVTRGVASSGQHQAAAGRARKGRNAPLDRAGIACSDWRDFNPQSGSGGLHSREKALSRSLVCVPKDGRPRDARRNLLEQLQPFCCHAEFRAQESCRVAARPRKALDETRSHRTLAIGNTMGTARVACSNGPTTEAPWATITSGAAAANSAACRRTLCRIASGPADIDLDIFPDSPA